jgi:hypothetical protein
MFDFVVSCRLAGTKLTNHGAKTRLSDRWKYRPFILQRHTRAPKPQRNQHGLVLRRLGVGGVIAVDFASAK